MKESAKRKAKSVKLKFKTKSYNSFKLRVLILRFALCALSFCGASTVSSLYAQQAVSSSELIEQAKELDGKEVVYAGEVIGEVMTRGDHSWVNLNDGVNAVGIWMENNFLSAIYFMGNYKSQGDWLSVRGIFNRACKAHGGDLDIHARNVVKIRSGRLVKHRLVPEKHRLVIILLGVSLCLLILQLWSKKLKAR